MLDRVLNTSLGLTLNFHHLIALETILLDLEKITEELETHRQRGLFHVIRGFHAPLQKQFF